MHPDRSRSRLTRYMRNVRWGFEECARAVAELPEEVRFLALSYASWGACMHGMDVLWDDAPPGRAYKREDHSSQGRKIEMSRFVGCRFSMAIHDSPLPRRSGPWAHAQRSFARFALRVEVSSGYACCHDA